MTDTGNESTVLSPAERERQGRALRKRVPRSSHGLWEPSPDRSDPLSLLREQDATRVRGLVPMRYGRMLESPFAFFRGAAAIMAQDLAGTPVSGLEVQLCGDAHIANFGVFATPERNMVFDVNDFDETYPGPWEWDVKRLCTSAVIAGLDNGFREKDCHALAVAAGDAYRKAMNRFARLSTLDMWYFHVGVDDVLRIFEKSSKKGRKSARKMVEKGQSRTVEQSVEKLTHLVDGHRRFINEPPTFVRLITTDPTEEQRFALEDAWRQYLESLHDDRRELLQRYRLVDVAMRVVGVGSVGTRATVALFEGPGGAGDAIILQQKEAGPSVLERYLGGEKATEEHARRVVSGQRMIQATSDIFLGWHRSEQTGTEFYWRQLRDMKGSADVSSMDQRGLGYYAGVCAACLARAHARTGDAMAISGYLGRSDAFARAVAGFAVAYARQNERDYEALQMAVESGRVVAWTGV